MITDFQNRVKPAEQCGSDSHALNSISWPVRSGQTMILIDQTSPGLFCCLEWISSVMPGGTTITKHSSLTV